MAVPGWGGQVPRVRQRPHAGGCQPYRSRPRPDRSRPWRLPDPLRILLFLVALRTNLTERALAGLLGVSHDSTHRAIAALTPVLATPVQLGAPRRHLDCGRHVSRDVQVLTRHHDRTVVTVGQACPGNRNEIVVVRETSADLLAHAKGTVLRDGGSRSHPHITIPPPRDRSDARRAHITARARVEHVLARSKDRQILRQCRRKGDAINHITKAVPYLHNLKQLRFIS